MRDLFARQLPELDSLNLHALDYAHVVRRLLAHTDGGGSVGDLTGVDLSDLLPPSSVMVLTVAASTSTGTALDAASRRRVSEGCDVVLALDDARGRLMQFVASRMTLIAPNVSAIVTTPIAAQLIGAAGGVLALSRMPAGHIQVCRCVRVCRGGLD